MTLESLRESKITIRRANMRTSIEFGFITDKDLT
jgi:hypothetical protein